MPGTETGRLVGLEYATLQIAALLFALGALANIFFWFFRKSAVGKVSWTLSLLAALTLTLSVVARWINVGHIPYVQIYETLLFATWAMSIVAVFSDQGLKTRLPSTIADIVATLILVYIIQWPAETKIGTPLVPALQSPWLDTHIATAFLSYAGFAISAGASVVFLFNRNEAVDELSYRLVSFAFPLLGLGIITGAVWANQAWGTYWSWDPKETAALVTWLLYAGYLHTRLVLKWKGTKSSLFNLIGFACVIFTWVGLNLLSKYVELQSMHTYSG